MKRFLCNSSRTHVPWLSCPNGARTAAAPVAAAHCHYVIGCSPFQAFIMACDFYWFGVQRHAVWKPSLEKKAHLAPQLWVLVFSAELTGSSSADRTMRQLNRAMEATSELLENCLERDMAGSWAQQSEIRAPRPSRALQLQLVERQNHDPEAFLESSRPVSHFVAIKLMWKLLRQNWSPGAGILIKSFGLKAQVPRLGSGLRAHTQSGTSDNPNATGDACLRVPVSDLQSTFE